MEGIKQLTPILWFLSLLSLVIGSGLFMVTASHTFAADGRGPISEESLGGADRYLAYLSTDKPIYRESEPVFLRTVVLNARDNTPFQDGNVNLSIKIVGPKGDTVHEGFATETQNVVGYRWDIPSGITGGEYTFKVNSASIGFAEAERNFDIRAYRAPRLKTQIDFTRDGYGAGDQVSASMTIARAEGGVPVGAGITAIARVDGVEVYRSSLSPVTSSGIINTSFALPEQIETGEGSLSFVMEDGGIVETASKTLPILLQKMEMSFYPEGGELVGGLSGRVYFQALLPNGKPADVQGHIVEFNSDTPGTDVVADFSSEHEGRGRFDFTPQGGKRYAAIVTSPSGITEPVVLPSVKAEGTTLQSNQSTYAYTDEITFSVASNARKVPAKITLNKRDVTLDSHPIDFKGNSVELKVDAKDAEGVLIATLWDKDDRPLAERLIYRQPRFEVSVKMKLSEGSFIPGGSVSVDILTSDKQGNPVEAVVGLTVTDDSVLELIEKREQAPRLPVMVYLENEALDLADAHVYLDRSNPIADTATDLLLGTQGWRRFVLVDYSDIKELYPANISRAMAERTPPPKPRPVRRALAMNAGVEMLKAAPMVLENRVEEDAFAVAVPLPPPAPEAVEEMPALIAAEPLMEKEIAGKQRAEADQQDMNMAMADAAMGMAARMPMREDIRRQVVSVREFAYKVRANRKPNDRVDFTETIYWNSGVKTSARDGVATVSFDLSDSVTTFRLSADAFGRNGAIGAGDEVVTSVEPFYIAAKMPLHAVAGDVIELPVTLVNTTEQKMNNARLQVTGEGIELLNIDSVSLVAGQRLRKVIKVTASQAGTFPINISAVAGPYTDNVTRQLTISSAGFPININEGGLLSSDSPFISSVTLPDSIAPGSLVATARIYPSPLASMEEALNALLREPHGCFEQTSSTNYPLVMAQQYFDTHTGVDPQKIATARDLLKVGYKKLISFESQDSGYEWFGANPAHEALTAYGLMEFSDMAKVMQVDPKMIDRTRQWLLDRRDGKGGFKRNDRALDSFGRAPEPTTNAYIVWSLLESGQHPSTLAKEIEMIKIQALAGEDSYIDALAANILYISGDDDSATALAKKLANAVDKDGAVSGAMTSITRSGGDSLSIETSSLALLAWLRDDETWAAQVETTIKWLFERSKAGRFGSTQSTVLALKAINAYDAARAVPKSPGSVQVFINGEAFGKPVSFTTESKGAIDLADFSLALSSGENDIELRMADGSKMPFSLDVKFHTQKPQSAVVTPVTVSTGMSHSTLVEGEPLELLATIIAGDDVVPTPVAIIGIPAGLELRHDQLKELKGNGSVSAYEVRGSELILYWRALNANEQRVIPVTLTAAVPGSYTAPASRVYPYYTDEQKHWIAGHTIEITAR